MKLYIFSLCEMMIWYFKADIDSVQTLVYAGIKVFLFSLSDCRDGPKTDSYQ